VFTKGDVVKALSIKQPWACAIAGGSKSIEVRSWATAHRGELLICASASPKNVFVFNPKNKTRDLLPAGCFVGIVELVDCRRMKKADEDAAMCDYEDGAYAWVLDNPQYVRPDKVTGRLGLFEVPEATEVVCLADEDEFFRYPPPQGDVRFKKGMWCIGEEADSLV
jgi:hypothetical protein